MDDTRDDLWFADCGCTHVLVGDDCPCGPTWLYDADGPYLHHNDPHTDERVVVDGR